MICLHDTRLPRVEGENVDVGLIVARAWLDEVAFAIRRVISDEKSRPGAPIV
jgi:hypothetical protein